MLTKVATSFPKFSFALESLNFTVDNMYCQLFSLKWQVCLVLFLRNHQPDTQVRRTIVVLSSFQVKIVFQENGG